MKKTKLAIVLAGIFGLGAAQATDIIKFDTNGAGGGGVIQVGSFDWSPGNSLAIGATPIPFAATGSPKAFDLYSQASLASFQDANGDVIANDGGLNSSYEITYQTGFGELGVASSGGFGNRINSEFELDPNASVNFFNMFYDTNVNSNNKTGDGFGDGIPILSAIVTRNATNFSIDLDAADPSGFLLDDLDKFGGTNDQPGIGTLVGRGGGDLDADVQTADSTYFKSDIVSLLVDLVFNTSNVVPFQQQEPTGPITAVSGVVGNLPIFGGAGVGGYALVNGLASTNPNEDFDFLFQTDANQSFFATPPIPEPGALALLGLGLAGLGGLRRLRKS